MRLKNTKKRTGKSMACIASSMLGNAIHSMAKYKMIDFFHMLKNGLKVENHKK